MDNIKLRTDKQLINDKRLSDFFKNYHAKIKELKEKENIDTDKKIEVVKEKKKRIKKSKKTSEPIVIIESNEDEKYIINI
jgi:hypothetical protein